MFLEGIPLLDSTRELRKSFTIMGIFSPSGDLYCIFIEIHGNGGLRIHEWLTYKVFMYTWTFLKGAKWFLKGVNSTSLKV